MAQVTIKAWKCEKADCGHVWRIRESTIKKGITRCAKCFTWQPIH